MFSFYSLLTMLILRMVVIRIGSVTSFFRNWSALELIGFCVFLENDKTDLRQFFLRFKRKHLFIAAYIEKHCTGTLTFTKEMTTQEVLVTCSLHGENVL